MSSSPLGEFDPFANHPFTNHAKGAMPAPPPPSKYPQGVPSAHVTFGYQTKPPSAPGTPSSPPTAPIPQYTPPQLTTSYSASSTSSTSSSSSASSPGGIFTPYRPDGRGIPDLESILSTKKKPTWSKK